MNYQIMGAKGLKWIAILAAALVALHQFVVQQLIAALLLFAVVFASIAALVLALLALDEAWRITFAKAQMYMKPYLRRARSSHTALINSSAANIMTSLLERRTTIRR